MIKAEKIVRDLLNDHCSGFRITHGGNEIYFTLFFEIPFEHMAYVDLKYLKKIVDALNVQFVRMETFDRGFRVEIPHVNSVFMLYVATVDGIRAKQDTSVGPVRCKSCDVPPFATLAQALEHVEFVHRGDVELDRTFDVKTVT